jgi:signal peptidase I
MWSESNEVPANQVKNTDRESRRRPLVAGLLSLAMAGLGQLYNGEPKKAAVLYLCEYALLLVFAVLACRSFVALLTCIVFAIVFQIVVIAEAAVRARRLGSIQLRRFNRWYVYVAVYAVLAFIFLPLAGSVYKGAGYGGKAFRIPSRTMSPTLVPGDHIMAELGSFESRDLRRGDIVVFEYPEDRSKDFIKRVIALGGEELEIRDKRVFIDGKPVQDPWGVFTSSVVLPGKFPPRDNLAPTKIPEGTVFVMGDNRDDSFDSRYFGPVSSKLIRGKALYIYWSDDLGRIGTSLVFEP